MEYLNSINYDQLITIFLAIGILFSCGDHESKQSSPSQNTYFQGSVPEVTSEENITNKQNVILISIDTLRWDTVFGSRMENSEFDIPNLNKLKNDSVDFRNVISTSSWTLPSFASFFTTKGIEKHGAYREKVGAVHPEVSTIPQIYKKIGYQTGGFVDGGYVGSARGFSRGFNTYWEQLDYYDRDQDRLYFSKNIDNSINWIEENNDKKSPFLLFLHTFQIHDYFRFYPKCDEELKENYDYLADELITERNNPSIMLIDEWKLNPRKLQGANYLYNCGIEKVDKQLGRFLNYLRQNNIYESSLIVFISDHGEGFSTNPKILAHGRRDDGFGQLNERLIRIPVVIKFPSNRYSDETISAQLSIKDLMPLIMQYQNIKTPSLNSEYQENLSLQRLLRGGDGRVFTTGALRHFNLPKIFVRGKNYKTTYNFDNEVLNFFKLNREHGVEAKVQKSKVPDDIKQKFIEKTEKFADYFNEKLSQNNTRIKLNRQQKNNLKGLGYM